MRLRGTQSADITRNWSNLARRRAIADLADNAKRSLSKDSPLREVLDRIGKLAGYTAKALQSEREYIIKGSRYAEEDRRQFLS